MEWILTQQKCEVCNAKAPLATKEQITSLKAQIPEWNIVEIGACSN